jgi:hypothetical protein
MKLKEWGYLRHRPRKTGQTMRDASQENTAGEDSMIVDDSDDTATPGAANTANTAITGILEGAEESVIVRADYDPIPKKLTGSVSCL